MSHNRPKAQPTRQLENERVIVTRWSFAPGAETGWHRHEHDYVVVPLVAGTLLLDNGAAGTAQAELAVGASYTRPAGVEHNVINANDYDFAFIEVELKT
ncbi:MAG: cupin domain-containing protein [Gammaproteobacteria bacterium]|jgi:quercetin dioxygenase-like cupin family protein